MKWRGEGGVNINMVASDLCSYSTGTAVTLTLYCPTNAHNVKKRRVIKTFLKIRKLLQHVSVYKETIIR